jgi:hypothetical protein
MGPRAESTCILWKSVANPSSPCGRLSCAARCCLADCRPSVTPLHRVRRAFVFVPTNGRGAHALAGPRRWAEPQLPLASQERPLLHQSRPRLAFFLRTHLWGLSRVARPIWRRESRGDFLRRRLLGRTLFVTSQARARRSLPVSAREYALLAGQQAEPNAAAAMSAKGGHRAIDGQPAMRSKRCIPADGGTRLI